jgi:hypothetical protein
LSPRARRSAFQPWPGPAGSPPFLQDTSIWEASWLEQPQEVEDEEYERVAAIDVAKASGVVCTHGRVHSDYWRVWYVVLEAAGLTVQLVNARAVKNVPGRAKTRRTRCGWRS